MSVEDKAAVKSALWDFVGEGNFRDGKWITAGDAGAYVQAKTGLDFGLTTIGRYLGNMGWIRAPRPGKEGGSCYTPPIHWPQGSGRTWRAIAALPDGAIYFIVPAIGETTQIYERLVEQGRPYKALDLIYVTDVEQQLRRKIEGRRGTPYAIDHAVYDTPIVPPEDRIALELLIDAYLAP